MCSSSGASPAMSGCLQDEEGQEVRLGEGGFGVVFKVCAHKLLLALLGRS